MAGYLGFGHRPAPAGAGRRGFTLIEILVVISVLAALATVGTVSFQSVREYGRDVKRVADMDGVQGALELYFMDHNTYPADAVPGAGGTVLGSERARVLDARGFVPVREAKPYLEPVPFNPEPGGAAYTYRSYNADGSDCDVVPCARYVVAFVLEGDTQQLAAGLHTISSEGLDSDATGVRVGSLVGGSLGALAAGGLGRAVFFFKDEAPAVLDNPVVEQGATNVVLPAASLVAVMTTMRAAPLSALPQYFLFFFTQPILFLFRPRRKSWGVVYHALSKLPVDLAVVRLREEKSGRLVRSAVTDRSGQYAFSVPEGRYRIDVSKSGFIFPTRLLADLTADGGFVDVYHGETIDARKEKAIVAPNIPLDPLIDDVPDVVLVRQVGRHSLKHAAALVGVVTAAGTFVAVPSVSVGVVLALHLLLYFFFRRVSLPPRQPREWGVVYEEGQAAAGVDKAVVRMFALPYHKMVDSQVTDARGRYTFLVGPAEVYLTVSKDGFLKTETAPLDLRSSNEPHLIAGHIPLRRTPPTVAEGAPR